MADRERPAPWWKALAAFLTLPGVMAGVIPLAIMQLPRRPAPQSSWMIVPLLFGLLILVSSVVSFYRRGKGTLAPWDPPRRLVVEDLYRFNRNPMYVGITLLLIGWAGILGSAWHYLYAALLLVAFHLRVVLYEEREMQRLFPQDWPHYRANVPRWCLRLTPYSTHDG